MEAPDSSLFIEKEKTAINICSSALMMMIRIINSEVYILAIGNQHMKVISDLEHLLSAVLTNNFQLKQNYNLQPAMGKLKVFQHKVTHEKKESN